MADSAGGEAPKPEKPDTNTLNSIIDESGNAQLLALFNQREELKQQFNKWQQKADKLKNRAANWSTLKQLLQLSKGLSFYQDAQKQYDAIIANRSLLDDPDPVEAQVTTITDKLRKAITFHANGFVQEYQQQKQQLENSSNWQKLTGQQQQQILDNRDLNEPEIITVNTVDDVIDSLEACSIEHWNARTQAQSSKFDATRLEAAKLLEPKVQQIKLPHRTLKSEEDIKSWLLEVETRMMTDIKNGPLVV